MTIHVLDGTAPVTIGPGALRAVAYGRPGGLAIKIDAIDVHGRAVEGLVRSGPGVVVIPSLTGSSRLRVSPDVGGVFAAGAAVGLTLVAAQAGGNDEIRLAEVDVAGLTARDLVVLEPGARGVTVGAIAGEIALEELAGRARAAAREILGVERVPVDHSLDVTIAIDGSASMRTAQAAASLSAVLDVLDGLAMTVGRPNRPVRVALVADELRWIDVAPAAGIAAAVDAALVTLPQVLGAPLGSSGLRTRYPDENSMTYVVTDGMPGELARITADNNIDGEARHLVLLAPQSPEPRPAGDVPTTWVGAGAALRERLLADGEALHRLVRGLLEGCFVPGTPLAERARR